MNNPGKLGTPLAPGESLEVKRAKLRRCLEAIEILRRKLDEWSPDAFILVGDDQRENILEDNTPPFVIYIEDQVDTTLHFKYLGESPVSQKKRYKVNSALARSLLNGLMEAGFDPAWSKKPRIEAGLGHAFGRALHFIMPDRDYPIVPVLVNTFYPPAPSANRCVDFAKALAVIVRDSVDAKRVVVLASGGLSHVRIDEDLDREFMKALQSYDGEYLRGMSSSVLVEGTSELRNWIIAATVAAKGITMVDYVPCYRQLTGIGCAMGFGYWE